MVLASDQEITAALTNISDVEELYIQRSGETVQVFTIIDSDKEETYDLIYDAERSLIREFHSNRFDFNVIARRGRDVSEIIGPMAPAWQREHCAHSESASY
jgi:hypothetical protein